MAALRRARLRDGDPEGHGLAALDLLGRGRARGNLPWPATRSRLDGRWKRREGSRDGRRRRHASAPAHLQPAEADGAHRRQAVHGAHPRAAQATRPGRRDRHGGVPAAGDPQLLRQRRLARDVDRVLGRGIAARHCRLGAPRKRSARRDLPRHLGRCSLRRGSDRPDPVPPGEGLGGHDRPQVGREPTRVRDRRHRRGGPDRAFPREALLEPGLLRHDQHGDLRPRAGGAAPHSDRPALRLLEGALPAAARDGPADVRLRLRGLLAGHREPRSVPSGELRRPRRARPSQHPGDSAAREHLAGGRGGGRRSRRDRGAGVSRQLLPHRAGRLRRPVLGTRLERDAARARPDRALRHRCRNTYRSQRPRRGSRRRAGVRHPRPRARPGRRRDRRRGDAGRSERRPPGGPDLPLQGGRDRRADPRERDLGGPQRIQPLRQGRRLRARQRGHHPGDRGSPCRRPRHGPEARRPSRREPRVTGRLPNGQAGDDLRASTRPG